MATPDDVVDQIVAQAPSQQVMESMLLGSSFEGGWTSPFPVGDQGTSFGPFQEHEGGVLTATGMTPQQAEDPAQAVKAMLPYYETASASIPQSLWSTNTELAAEEAAVAAERPAQSYLSAYGQGALDTHWGDVSNVLYPNSTFRSVPSNSLPPNQGGGSVGNYVSGQYIPAVNVLGTTFKYIDGFLNPDISLVPGWADAFTGINETAKTLIKFVDRIVGVIIGIGFVYIGVHTITSRGSSSTGGTLRTAIRAGANVATGREVSAARVAVAETRAKSSSESTAQRAVAQAQVSEREAARERARQADIKAERERQEQMTYRARVKAGGITGKRPPRKAS